MGKNDSHDLFRELLYSKVTCASADTVKKKRYKKPILWYRVYLLLHFFYCFSSLLFVLSYKWNLILASLLKGHFRDRLSHNPYPEKYPHFVRMCVCVFYREIKKGGENWCVCVNVQLWIYPFSPLLIPLNAKCRCKAIRRQNKWDELGEGKKSRTVGLCASQHSHIYHTKTPACLGLLEVWIFARSLSSLITIVLIVVDTGKQRRGVYLCNGACWGKKQNHTTRMRLW